MRPHVAVTDHQQPLLLLFGLLRPLDGAAVMLSAPRRFLSRTSRWGQINVERFCVHVTTRSRAEPQRSVRLVVCV